MYLIADMPGRRSEPVIKFTKPRKCRADFICLTFVFRVDRITFVDFLEHLPLFASVHTRIMYNPFVRRASNGRSCQLDNNDPSDDGDRRRRSYMRVPSLVLPV